MKRFFTFYFIVFMICKCCIAQQLPYFNTLYPQVAYLGSDIIELNDGYMILGSTDVGGYSIPIVTKIGKQGDTLWHKKMGTPPNQYFAGGLTETYDGKVVIAFGMSGTIANEDILLFKIEPNNGDTIWSRSIGDIQYHEAVAKISETKDKGFIIAGVIAPVTGDQYDVLFIKIDSIGNVKWSKQYGGNLDENVYSLSKTLDGGYIIGGSSKSFGNDIDYDMYVVKTDSIGNKQWERTYGTLKGNDNPAFVTTLNDGNYIIASAIDTFQTAFRYAGYLAKISNRDGHVIWQKIFKDNLNAGFFAQPIESPDGTLFNTGGYCNSQGYPQVWTIKTDAIGDTIRTQTYFTRSDQSCYAYDVISTSDGGYIYTGSAWDSIQQGLWIVKLDCMGNDSVHYAPQNNCCGLNAVKQILSRHPGICKGDSLVITLASGYSYQWSNGTTNATITIKQAGTYQATITDLQSCGSVALAPITVEIDTVIKPKITKQGNQLLSNSPHFNQWYRNGFAIDTLPIHTLTSTGTYTLTVRNYCGTFKGDTVTVVGINEINPLDVVSIFPNPVSNGELRIENGEFLTGINLYNILGEKVLDSKNFSKIDVSSLAKGVYTIILSSKQARTVRKIIIQ